MRAHKTFIFLAILTVCTLLVTIGCEEPARQPKVETAKVEKVETAKPEAAKPKVEKAEAVKSKAEPPTVKVERPKTTVAPVKIKAPLKPLKQQKARIALKLDPNDCTTYKLITKIEDSVQYSGSLKDEPKLQDRSNQRNVEMVFDQKIEKIDEQGNAIATITVKELKYSSVYRNEPVLNIDSKREEDKGNPLLKLLGQSYGLKIAPTGQVLEVLNVHKARNALTGNSTATKAGWKLVSPDIIKERHSVAVLPEVDKNEVKTGDNWSSVKVFDFGKLGAKPYEKIYTLMEVIEQNGEKTAVIEMKAEPTSIQAEHSNLFMQMFENTYTYSGNLEMDLKGGKIKQCHEELKSKWIAVDPEADTNNPSPDTITMTSLRSYRIKQVD
ncbi:MAG: DUF6263 family protein [Planctomycetota bacterium]